MGAAPNLSEMKTTTLQNRDDSGAGNVQRNAGGAPHNFKINPSDSCRYPHGEAQRSGALRTSGKAGAHRIGKK